MHTRALEAHVNFDSSPLRPDLNPGGGRWWKVEEAIWVPEKTVTRYHIVG